MKRSRSTDSEAMQAGRLAEMALRASLGALGPDDLIVIGPGDPQTGAPDPGADSRATMNSRGAERLAAFAQKYNIPTVRMHWPD